MYPLSQASLTLGEVARHWARDLPQRPTEEEVRTRLVEAIWRGELEIGDGEPAPRRQLLSGLHLFRNARRDDTRIAILAEENLVPPQSIVTPDGGMIVDPTVYIVLPAREEDWTEDVIANACAGLAKCDFDDYNSSIKAGFLYAKIYRDHFAAFCERAGYALPPFWFGRSQSTATVGARARFREWLREQIKQPKVGPQETYWERAKRLFPRLSHMAFLEVWADVVPVSWRKPGRIRKSQRPPR